MKTYHDESFHLVPSVAHMFDAKVPHALVKEPPLLFPHLSLDIDDACHNKQ